MVKLRHMTLIVALLLMLSGCEQSSGIFNPKGIIAAKEKALFIEAVSLMLIVVIPVIMMSFLFAWKYRASNTKAKYRPNWSHSLLLECIVWGVSIAVIAVLGPMAWITAHRLDPYRPLNTTQEPLKVQVIALNWKWLFIYPKQNIATVNDLTIPVHRPVLFLVTSDAPMNSFAIPQLGSQIYAMSGVQTKLHLIGTEIGSYRGLSTNFSGDGFADMNFKAHVVSQDDFDAWVKKVQATPDKLTMTVFTALEKPSIRDDIHYYSSVQGGIYGYSIMQYMGPMNNPKHNGIFTMNMDMDEMGMDRRHMDMGMNRRHKNTYRHHMAMGDEHRPSGYQPIRHNAQENKHAT